MLDGANTKDSYLSLQEAGSEKSRIGWIGGSDQLHLSAGGNTFAYFMPKYSIFLGYGKRNAHTLNHENFYKSRDGYKKLIPEKLKILLDENNLL